MQLDTGFVVHGIFDNTQQALVGTLSDDNRFANELIAAKSGTGWWHSSRVAVRACIEGRVDATKIWALCLSATTLCCHGNNVVASNHEDALVLDELAVPYEKCASVDV